SHKPAKTPQATLIIRTDHASKEIEEVDEDESYVLEVSTAGAKLTAPTPLGAVHGLQTFLQLVDISPDGFAAAAVAIQDKPRFPWRGLMIDSARHFGIRVVPEFDLPGHSTAWFVGHPELASGPGPYQIERRWGVFDPAFDPTSERTYRFLDEFIGEMAKLFPDQFFHVGGDEVNGKQWDANQQIQEFMRAHGIKNNQALQAYFNKRLQAVVEKHGKKIGRAHV